MACRCEKCGKPTYDCGSRLCGRCIIEESDSPVDRNLNTGGRFCEEKLEKESEA